MRRKRWSSCSRIIGFEHDRKTCWVICEGVPFCLATEKIRPANDAQTLAYRLMHEGEDRLAPEVQQSFIDNRIVPDEEEEEDASPELEGEEEAVEAENDPPQLVEESDEEKDNIEEAKRRRIEAIDDVPYSYDHDQLLLKTFL